MSAPDSELMGPEHVEAWLSQMQQQLLALLGNELQDCIIIGIHTGGVTIANRLYQALKPTMKSDMDMGQLNISFYRDDFSRIGVHPVVTPSELPFDIEDRTIVLVDDVLNSGRTIRAAMNEIFDFGRPSRIVLAVLIDRSGRQLPIQPDVYGHRIDLRPDQHIKLDTDGLTCSIY